LQVIIRFLKDRWERLVKVVVWLDHKEFEERIEKEAELV
jgi:hypothetical protein